MNILTITVTYHPDLAVLSRQLRALEGGEGETGPIVHHLLVDNGSEPVTLHTMRRWATTDSRITLLELGENRGIAEAHNRGIDIARHQGFSHVLLMDQDSLPAPDMVRQLAKAWEELGRGTEGGVGSDLRVAAVGPHYTDPVLRNPPDFVQVHFTGLRRHAPDAAHPLVPVDYLISSGCLISLDALAAIGTMQEALFIDYVDIEWGLRARRLGWQLYGVFPAHMVHSLGPQTLRFFWRRFPLHQPQRHYFVVRNALWLYRDGHLPWRWRLPHAARLAVRVSIYLIMGERRRERLRFVLLGIVDGLTGRMGKPGWMD